MFLAFSLAHVLRVTTACTFASLIWPDGSAPAALASLRSHKSLEKHSDSRLSYLFAHRHLLSSDLVSSDSSHLCFSTVHIVGSFTSKLPSTISKFTHKEHDLVQRCRHSRRLVISKTSLDQSSGHTSMKHLYSAISVLGGAL